MTRDRLPDLLKKTNVWCIEPITDEKITYGDYSLKELQRMENIKGFLNEYSEIKHKLETIDSNLDAMNRMTQQTNITNFNENELDSLRNENLKLGQQLMKIFNILKINLPNNEDFTLEARMKRGLFYGLQKHYHLLWHRQEAFLMTYETKLKKQLLYHAKILNWNATEEEVEEIIANNQTHLFVDNILEETENERRKLRDLMDRYSELKKLEKSIEDVHALFLRIQNLVLEQSELIQVIEHHAMQASAIVDKAEKETDEAQRHYKKALEKKTCLIVFGVVLLIILILFLFI